MLQLIHEWSFIHEWMKLSLGSYLKAITWRISSVHGDHRGKISDWLEGLAHLAHQCCHIHCVALDVLDAQHCRVEVRHFKCLPFRELRSVNWMHVWSSRGWRPEYDIGDTETFSCKRLGRHSVFKSTSFTHRFALTQGLRLLMRVA